MEVLFLKTREGTVTEHSEASVNRRRKLRFRIDAEAEYRVVEDLDIGEEPARAPASGRTPIIDISEYRIAEDGEVGKRALATAYGRTRIVDISSDGVLFHVCKAYTFNPGAKIELRVAWPPVAGFPNLKLWITGKVVRCAASLAALRIERYEFRTAATAKPRLAPGSWGQPGDLLGDQGYADHEVRPDRN